jgi:hypothetical protein
VSLISPRPSTRAQSRTRRIVGSAALSALIVLVVSLPAAPAQASAATPTPSLTLPAEVSGLPSGEVGEVLSSIPLNDLSATRLGEVLAKLPGLSALPSGLSQGDLATELANAIEALAGEGDTLGQLSNPAQLLDGLLSSASKPEQLLEQLLADIDSGKLQALLGTIPTGEPVSKTTVGELTSQLETTDEGLASSLDTTTTELPASAMALTTPLADGKTLAVLDGAKELSLATLVPSDGGSGGSGGSTGSGGSGGTGGPGGDSGDGSSGTAGGTTVIVNNLPQSSSASAAGAKPVVGKVKIISRKVRGNVVTMVVQVPGAGRLTVAGSGARTVSEQASAAERVTVRTTLTKAGVASRRKHPRDFKVKLKASFKPIDGTSSSATSTATFG